MLQSRQGMGVGGGGEMARTEERICTYLLKRSIDGWKGNLNVISKGLRLDPEKSNVPAWGWEGVIQFFGTGALLLIKMLWFFSHLHLKTFHSNNYIHRLEINTKWCLLMQKPKNWTGLSSVRRTKKKKYQRASRGPIRSVQKYTLKHRLQIQWTHYADLTFHLSQSWRELWSAATLASCSLL